MSLAQKLESFYPDGGNEFEEHRQPKRPRRIDPAVYISVFALIVLAASLVHVGQRARVALLTYELQNAKSRLEQLKRVQSELKVEIEEARTLGRVEETARDKLGMVRPKETEWVVLNADRSGSTTSIATAHKEGWPWLTALTEWYDRVSSGIKAALPMHVREAGR